MLVGIGEHFDVTTAGLEVPHPRAQGAADLLTNGIASNPGDEPRSIRWS